MSGRYTKWDATFRLDMSGEFSGIIPFESAPTELSVRYYTDRIMREKLNVDGVDRYTVEVAKRPAEMAGFPRRIVFHSGVKCRTSLNFEGAKTTEYRTISNFEVIEKLLIITNEEFFTEISVKVLTNLMREGMLTDGYWEREM